MEAKENIAKIGKTLYSIFKTCSNQELIDKSYNVLNKNMKEKISSADEEHIKLELVCLDVFIMNNFIMATFLKHPKLAYETANIMGSFNDEVIKNQLADSSPEKTVEKLNYVLLAVEHYLETIEDVEKEFRPLSNSYILAVSKIIYKRFFNDDEFKDEYMIPLIAPYINNKVKIFSSGERVHF
ncbi:MAG: hypothetical protein A3J83_03875 [Elusimicrobia bacterium RIFOXYA2_FULL_40_6]|nr:MAG: hypothetical protein A3J83_03875 [Elusimicrobia bacterium RIFOXYA2_FULL_40_6]